MKECSLPYSLNIYNNHCLFLLLIPTATLVSLGLERQGVTRSVVAECCMALLPVA